MPKPDPALLDPARYPFSCEIATRFADLDLNRHLNNVALSEICEEARVRFHGASGFVAAISGGGAGSGAMVASFAIEYLGQGYHPDPVTAHVAATRIGGSSYGLAILIRQNERTVAHAQAVMVAVLEGKPAPIPASFRETAGKWMLRP
jgi:acyl-CoA thioester hydrolase